MPHLDNTIPEPVSSAGGPTGQARRPFARRHALMIRVLAILLLLSLAACAYFAYQYYRLQSNPTLKAQTETQQTLAQLSKVMMLPNDPNPVIATITDKTKLEGQPFFKNAQNGDRVVIFPSTMKAVLFRPSTGKIIDVAPLEQSQQNATVPEQAPAAPAKTSSKPANSSVSTASTTAR